MDMVIEFLMLSIEKGGDFQPNSLLYQIKLPKSLIIYSTSNKFPPQKVSYNKTIQR